MKVILTAFFGRLRSDPIEWPENSPASAMIRLPMNPKRHFGFEEPPIGVQMRTGFFEWTGKYLMPAGTHEPMREYVLVDLQ